jgi:hypothetical protein
MTLSLEVHPASGWTTEFRNHKQTGTLFWLKVEAVIAAHSTRTQPSTTGILLRTRKAENDRS